MAAPLKRICRQTAPFAAQCRHRSQQSSFIGITHGYNQQQQPQRRHNSTSTTDISKQESHDVTQHEDLGTSLEALDESLPDEQELSSNAHLEIDQHREIRNMVRLAAWQMPLLSRLSQPFEKPDRSKLPLQWRYTTYFGESHPASRKVVVKFRIRDVTQGWNEVQIDKLRKLAGPRYKPESMKMMVDQVIPEHIHMSCESFETQAQNKRYLADTINKLLAEAKDLSTDSFEDVPLDTRHVKLKKVLKYSRDFPEEWKLNDEKRKALEEKRKAMLLAEAKRVEQGMVISGAAAIEYDRQLKSEEARQS